VDINEDIYLLFMISSIESIGIHHVGRIQVSITGRALREAVQ
jgi:hypothetical protein